MSQERKDQSKAIREKAAKIAHDRPLQPHQTNGEKENIRKKDGSQSYLMTFSKGIRHNEQTGLVERNEDQEALQAAIDSGTVESHRALCKSMAYQCSEELHPQPWRSAKADQNGSPVPYRAWESIGAGFAFDLEGPDAQAVTMKPCPALGSKELTAEMAEVYAQALLRDVPFTALNASTASGPLVSPQQREKVQEVLAAIESNMRDANRANGTGLSPGTAFRGMTAGDQVGPYLSQFMLMGTSSINGADREQSAYDGKINYGAQLIDQKVRYATPFEDHLQNWDEYLDAQDGADLRGKESYGDGRRFITTPRDLSTYVHYDALYQAYLNACIMLLGAGIDADCTVTKFDEGIPFQGPDFFDRQQGFAHFGGPHILTLVTEVATRALKAVRYQKFQNHLRLRPEALAARIHKADALRDTLHADHSQNLDTMVEELSQILELVNQHNNDAVGHQAVEEAYNYLLPMAFCEGSPMHPSYGAGHATVAGACVTILKAFFHNDLYLNISADGASFSLTDRSAATNRAFVANPNGDRLELVHSEPLSVVGELNKLAANISIGRDWAGVHYFSDYTESLKMGEEIAIGILEEQSITYLEDFSMSLQKFDGSTVVIGKGNGYGNTPGDDYLAGRSPGARDKS